MAINVPLNAQLQNATQLQQQIQNAVNSVQLNLGGAGGSRALNSLSQPLGRLTGQADEFTKSLDAANARVLAFGASVGVLNAITNAFKAMINTTITVEKTLADINVVFNKSSTEIKNFGKGIFDVAKQTGQSFEEVSKAALEFSRQGLTIEDTLARTKDALVLTRLTGLDTAKAVQGLTATINSFSKEALTSSEIINKLASVDQQFAVSAADLTEALSRSASVAQNAGVSFDELIGIVTSLQERTARGGAVIGNSIKTIFTRIQRPEVLKDLQDLGVAIRDVKTDNLLSASEILKNLAGNIGALGQIQKSGIFEEVAGGFQINQLQALLTDLAGAQSTASKAQKVATGATNEAYVANERLNQTISALINNSIEGLKELGATLGDLGIAESIKTALGVVNGFIENVQGLLEGDGPGAKFAQGIVKGIGSVLSGPGLALFGVIISKLVIDLGRFATQGLKTFLGIGKAASEQKALQEAIVTTLSRNAALQAQIGKFQGNAVAQASILAGIYNQQEASLKRQNAIAAGMSSVLYAQGMRAGPQGFTQKGRAAGGYLPSAEAADVSRGVGGASPSAQVVSIPNFAFGNGQRGTMVANTSEYIVPNYANGGSAIFNQDMVRSMGLPAGAQKIRAAGGYVPNFAKPLVIDAQKDLGGIGMITIGGDPNEKGNAAYRFSYQRAGISANKINNLKNTSYAKDSSPIHVVNMIGSKGLTALGEGSDESKRSAFSSKLNSKIVPSIVDLSRDLFKDYFEVPNLTPITSKPSLSPSVEGNIFQEIVATAVDSFRKDGQSTAFQGEDNRPFDYNPQEPADPKLQKLFFDNFEVLKADAKRSDNNESRESMVKKIFNDSYIFKKLLNNRPDIKNEIGENITLNAGSKRSQSITKSSFLEKNSSKGYIPNFANQALTDSINREKIQSGLPISAISVTQDRRLMNSRNPTGLAVINSRDEPNGKIPNFAAPKPLTATDFSNPAVAQALGTSLADLNKKIIDLTSSVAKGTKTQDQADAELKNFINTLPNQRAGATGNLTTNTPGSGQEIYKKASSTLKDATSDKGEKLAKGFGDAAGKIFLLQTAVSFVTGALGDLETSTGKIINKFAETSANITSLAIAGNEIATADLPGKLGGFAKGIGLLGVGVGVAYEGFKLLDFYIKESSGENAKAASALNKLETAAQSAAVSLEDLGPEGQRLAKEASLKSLESMRAVFFGSKAGDNPEIQKQALSLGSQGIGGDRLKTLVEEQIKLIYGANLLEKAPEEFKTGTTPQDIAKDLNIEKIDISESLLSKAISKVFGLPEVVESGKKLAGIREGVRTGDISSTSNAKELTSQVFGPSATKEQEAIVDSILQKNNAILVRQQASIDADKKLNLGKRLSLDLAKLEVDNTVELTRKKIESSGEEEDSIKLRMESLNITNAEKIALESKLKAIELEKKLRVDILNSVKEGVDKAAASNIDVTKESLDEVKKLLASTDFSQIDLSGKTDKGIEELERLKAQLESIGDINPELAKNIIDSIAKQIEGKRKIYDLDVYTNEALRDQSLIIDENKQRYEGQLAAITRIAALAKATADLNVSGLTSDKEAIAAQISLLEDANTNSYSGVLDKKANEKEILNLKLQQLQLDRQINAENKNARSIDIAQRIKKQEGEVAKVEISEFGADSFLPSTEYTSKLTEAKGQLEILKKEQSEITNQISAQNIGLEAQIALTEKRIALFDKRGTFKEGLSAGLQELENSTLDFQNTLGKEIPQLFSSNLAQGLNDAISGAKSLKEALTDAATSFLNAITQRNIQNLADMVTGGIGGFFTKKASGGMINGGSGTKDDVPAMLMGGEYVVKKSAVKKYGSNFLDSLNQGKLSGYASGGAVQSGKGGFYAPGEYGQGAITGQRQLLEFATQDMTSGQFDKMGSYGMTGASINLEAESGRLTMAGRENSPIFERTQQAKEEAFQVYLDSLKVDQQYREQLKQMEEAEKARKKQLTTAIVSAVVSSAVSVGGKAFGAGFKNAAGAAKALNPDIGTGAQIWAGVKGGFGSGGTTGTGGLGNLFSGNFSSAFTNYSQMARASGTKPNYIFDKGQYKGTSVGGTTYLPSTKFSDGVLNTGGFSASTGGDLDERLAAAQTRKRGEYIFQNGYYYRSRANGGPIFGGSGVSDDVPAMLTGGEFVLNNRATKKIGMGNLQRLNSGDTSSQQDPEKGSSDLMQALISKLDELISATSKAGGDNVVVNVNSNEAQGERNDGQKSAGEKELHKKIKAAVLEVITQEKRLGGSLNK